MLPVLLDLSFYRKLFCMRVRWMTCITFLQDLASSRPFLRRAASIDCLRRAQLIKTLYFLFVLF
jgi:hypothetical protein